MITINNNDPKDAVQLELSKAVNVVKHLRVQRRYINLPFRQMTKNQ